MMGPGVPNDQRKLLTDDALKAATARIKVAKIDKPTISGDTTTIKAHLSLDGKAFDYDFTASKTSGPFAGRWIGTDQENAFAARRLRRSPSEWIRPRRRAALRCARRSGRAARPRGRRCRRCARRRAGGRSGP